MCRPGVLEFSSVAPCRQGLVVGTEEGHLSDGMFQPEDVDMDAEILRDTLMAYPFLNHAPADLQSALQREAQAVRVPTGSRIFEPEAACNSFPLVAGGVIRVGKIGEKGRELVLYRVQPGEYCVLSLCGLMKEGTYPAIAIAEDEVRGILLPQGLFDKMFTEIPDFRKSVFDNMWNRLGTLIDLVGEFAFLRLDQRVASLLLRLSQDGANDEIAITHQDLANQIGSSREIISRALEMLAAEGLLSLRRGRITVERPAELRQRARANP